MLTQIGLNLTFYKDNLIFSKSPMRRSQNISEILYILLKVFLTMFTTIDYSGNYSIVLISILTLYYLIFIAIAFIALPYFNKIIQTTVMTCYVALT